MKIIGYRWTWTVNMLLIRCACGAEFEHRADRWAVKCSSCGRRDSLGCLRQNATWVAGEVAE